MEFSELKANRLASLAFVDFVSMQEAKETGIVPKEYSNIFKDRCGPLCGSEIIIKNTRTQYMCCNPRCPYKMAENLHYMFKSFNCTNIGPETCNKILYSVYGDMKNPSHILALLTPEERMPMTIGHSAMISFLDGVAKIRRTRLTFAQMISRIGIPQFGPNSESIFRDIGNVREFIDKIREYDSIDQFLRYRNVYSESRAFYLKEFLVDIGIASTRLFEEVTASGLVEIPVVVTGTLHVNGDKIPRDDFIVLCNRKVTLEDGRKLFDIKSTKQRETTEHFVADYPTSDRSYVVASRREADEGRKLIYTADEFIAMLEENVSVFKNWESNKESDLDG